MTPEGSAAYAGLWNAPTTTDEAIAVWDSKLSDRHRAMLNRLIEAHGEPVSKTELCEVAGMTPGGSFNGRLSELASTGLVQYAGKGFVKANKKTLFLD